ncbi:MAG: metallophosphoesterase [Halohasta sp.]
MPIPIPDAAVEPPLRDSVDALATEDTPPAIVSISDIHGYLEAARSALTTLGDHPDYEPVVVADADGTLHWADNDYVLVFNGDLVDRGPANDAVLALVGRLIDEAPPGRVRVTLGNHEALICSPEAFGFTDWYSGQVDDAARRQLCRAISAGHVVAAYEGYGVTYAHAGSADPYDVSAVNESLVAAAGELRAAIGTDADRTVQADLVDDYPAVLGVGRSHLKGPEAGLVWLHFDHLPSDAPPQVVGHTRHDSPAVDGQVSCQNVIRNNLDSPGGEAVFVETPDRLDALVRQADGGVSDRRIG